MKRLLLLPGIACMVLLVFGCDRDSPVMGPTSDPGPLGAPAQRPEFVDHRPATAIAASAKLGSPRSSTSKKRLSGGVTHPGPNPGQKYAYVIGISDYEGTTNDLRYCDDDARAMAQFFQSQGFTVRSDIDRNATAANIEAGLTWLKTSAGPSDEIALYYSGHGTSYQTSGSCLISTDLYYLAHDWVMQFLDSALCSKRFISMDACKLGSFHSSVPTGMIMATASTNGYSYDAPDLNQGAWTHFFLKGARTMVYGEDICSYANAGMKTWAKAHWVEVAPKLTDMYTGKLDI